MLQKLVIFVLILVTKEVFGFNGVPVVRSTNALKMAGGRSSVEVKRSKRNMFKDLREKLNEQATQDGFFDVKDRAALDIELFCKSNNDGSQIGDCPFTHFVQMVMLRKGIHYTVRPTASDAKPDWLVNDYAGKMPCLVHKGQVITDSLAIAEFLEKEYPHATLTRQGVMSYQEVIEKTAGFFPAMSAWIKNTDDSKDSALREAFESQLNILDELIRSTPGQYISGIEANMADLYLAPFFYHGVVALEHFKDYQFYHIDGVATRPALENYIARLMDMEEFNDKKAYYNVDQIISGWKKARVS